MGDKFKGIDVFIGGNSEISALSDNFISSDGYETCIFLWSDEGSVTFYPRSDGYVDIYASLHDGSLNASGILTYEEYDARLDQIQSRMPRSADFGGYYLRGEVTGEGNTVGSIVYGSPTSDVPPEDANQAVIPETPDEIAWYDSVWDAIGEFNDTYKVTTRAWGVAQMGFSIGEMFFATALIFAPEPTFVSKVVGGVIYVNASDNFAAGYKQLLTGEIQETFSERALKAGAEAIGIPEADAMALVTIGAIFMNPPGATQKVVNAAEESLETAVKTEKKVDDGAKIKGVKKIPKVKVACFDKEGGQDKQDNGAEMDRQLQGQQEGLNKLTVSEYIDNRSKKTGTNPCTGQIVPKVDRDRSIAAKARKRETTKRIEKYRLEFQKKGQSKSDAIQLATKRAQEEMGKLVALHNPDLIAGGRDIITGFGDPGVNSSIGSSWRSRVGAIDLEACRALAAGLGEHLMNVELKRCGPKK